MYDLLPFLLGDFIWIRKEQVGRCGTKGICIRLPYLFVVFFRIFSFFHSFTSHSSNDFFSPYFFNRRVRCAANEFSGFGCIKLYFIPVRHRDCFHFFCCQLRIYLLHNAQNMVLCESDWNDNGQRDGLETYGLLVKCLNTGAYIHRHMPMICLIFVELAIQYFG